MLEDPFIGTKIELLTVLSRDSERSSGTALYYHCRCICGNTKSFLKQRLTSGRVYSCGCSKPAQKRRVFEPGLKLGLWTLLEKDSDRSNKSVVYWRCQCDCGTVRSVSSPSLSAGLSQSCGCLRKSGNRKVTSRLGRPRSRSTESQE